MNTQNKHFTLPTAKQNARIAIFGGSFDPPHLSHQLLALSLLAIEPIDSVWVMPCASHASSKPLSDFKHRFKMCELAFGRLSTAVQCIDIEHCLPKPSLSAQTLEAIHKQRPDLSLSFIIGSDLLPQIKHWHDPSKLSKLSQIIVVYRQGFPITKLPTELPGARLHLASMLPDVTSTDLRRLFEQNHINNKNAPLDQAVREYAIANNLYDKIP